MKRTFFIFTIFTSIFMACEEDETLELADENAIEFEGNNAVIKANDLSSLRFKEVPGTISLDENVPEGEIKVEASEELNELIEVNEEGDELRI